MNGIFEEHPAAPHVVFLIDKGNLNPDMQIYVKRNSTTRACSTPYPGNQFISIGPAFFRNALNPILVVVNLNPYAYNIELLKPFNGKIFFKFSLQHRQLVFVTQRIDFYTLITTF